MTDKAERIKSIEDIARECRVSASTVSRVLNNEPGISAETRKKVMRVVERHGFSLQKRKRPLNRSQLNLVIVVPEEEELSANPFFNISELLNAINEAFQDDKKRVEVVTIDDFERYISIDVPAMDGILFAYRAFSESIRSRIRDLGIPYIFLSRVFPGDNYVSCNYYKGALMLAGHLLAMGRRRIGYLGNLANPTNIDRRRGYRTALDEAGIDIVEERIHEVDTLFKVDRETAGIFVERGCDAVICFNDYMAVSLINELNALGVDVPGEICVTGFDNSPLSRVCRPAVTTVQQPAYEMGFLAARWLRENILNRKTRDLRIEVEGQLILRESTGSNTV